MIADEVSNKRQSYSDILLEHVKVLAIDQIANEAEEKPTVARAVTLEVTKEQAQKILLATNVGKLSLILSRPIESGGDPNRRIGERDIGRIIPRASEAGRASPTTRSRRSGTSAAIKPGEGHHCTKWGEQGIFGDAQ
jgi:Flp pilus assembly protein CpaB